MLRLLCSTTSVRRFASSSSTKITDALMKRREAAVPKALSAIHPVFINRADNTQLFDVDGRRFLDFAGGIAVMNVGHSHPAVKAAVHEQIEKFSHTCMMVVSYESYVAVCERLNKLMPGNFAKKSCLFVSGAEAVENAVKVARAYTKRTGVIAFTTAYHGRTIAALALNGKVAPYRIGMGLMPGGVFRAQFPHHNVSIDDAMASIEQIFKNDAEPTDIAAIILEPVQGEGGFYPAPPAFMRKLRELCDKHGICLIADEVQTGAGRTGTFFAMEQMGVAADITTFAKSVGGGLPISGIIGKAEIMDSVVPGGLGGTYGGAPVACAAALAVLDLFENEKLCDRAKDVGQRTRARLLAMQRRWPQVIGDVRGLGAMMALEVVDASTGAYDAALSKQIITNARDNGLLLLSCGYSAIRLLMPLTIPFDQLDEGLNILEKSIEQSLKK